RESLATLNRALELGIDFYDTADVYGPYTNEELLGGWLKGKRDRVFLATKFANIRDASGQFVGVSGKPEYVRTACEASLRRLGVALVPYSPLGRGFLSGVWSKPGDIPEGDRRRDMPRFQGENFEKNRALVETLKSLAERRGATPAQMALAWVLAQGDDIVPI